MCGALRVSSTDSAAAEGPRTSRARIRAKTKATPAANLQARRKLRVPALCSRGSGFSRELLILVNASKKQLLRPLPQQRQAYGETPSGVRLKRLWRHRYCAGAGRAMAALRGMRGEGRRGGKEGVST